MISRHKKRVKEREISAKRDSAAALKEKALQATERSTKDQRRQQLHRLTKYQKASASAKAQAKLDALKLQEDRRKEAAAVAAAKAAVVSPSVKASTKADKAME